jgi:hypothetical protein
MGRVGYFAATAIMFMGIRAAVGICYGERHQKILKGSSLLQNMIL